MMAVPYRVAAKPPRGSFRRAFLTWHAEGAGSLALPLAPRPAARGDLRLHVPRLHPAVELWLQQGSEIVAPVTWEGHGWDLLISIEGPAVRTEAGFVHAYPAPGFEAPFPTLDLLWRAMVFEPFRDWLNGCLAPATDLLLYAMDGNARDGFGATWAVIARDGTDLLTGRPSQTNDLVASVPLWTGAAP